MSRHAARPICHVGSKKNSERQQSRYNKMTIIEEGDPWGLRLNQRIDSLMQQLSNVIAKYREDNMNCCLLKVIRSRGHVA